MSWFFWFLLFQQYSLNTDNTDNLKYLLQNEKRVESVCLEIGDIFRFPQFWIFTFGVPLFFIVLTLLDKGHVNYELTFLWIAVSTVMCIINRNDLVFEEF